ncbi:membrane-bound inhibitor of C-type lysozyme [Bartonella callosciuri]|uniref:Membrane-bound inhibitor of C-type lysozyme n=1 Tax=Bartonella callosciuri TaxID=686223 RepID=A0A840NWP7_9HYPH|nr:MliC family protein [Bartonella callosciuri]MBB5073712.1 membrane-bound inhibitor of C-type lysozyme [Bartonella callosciuri]
MKKTSFTVQFLTTLSLSLLGLTSAFASSLVIEVPDDPEPTIQTIAYQCDMGTSKERFEATYHNAGTISLVDLKWKGKRMIGSNVIAASGAKYVGGPYIWWTQKNEATFYDLMNDPNEEKPINCVEEQGTE